MFQVFNLNQILPSFSQIKLILSAQSEKYWESKKKVCCDKHDSIGCSEKGHSSRPELLRGEK